MKRILLLVFICLLSGAANAAESRLDSIWNKANSAYRNANYVEAIEGYQTILDHGRESADLYLNLGNAYFKRKIIGKAILNYNRSLKLSPASEDAMHNLTIANSLVQDKIDIVPTFFLKRWMNEARICLTSNAWAAISLVLFALMLCSTLFYLLSGRLTIRKYGFYGGIIFAVLMVFTLVFASSRRRAELYPDQAIIMSGAAAVKSSPDAGSKELFVLHEGTKVNVRSSLGDFFEISISNGSKGWIESSAIELID